MKSKSWGDPLVNNYEDVSLTTPAEPLPEAIVGFQSAPAPVEAVAPAAEPVVPVDVPEVVKSGTEVTVKLLTKQRNGTLVFYNVEDVQDVRNVDKEGKKAELRYGSRPQTIDKVIWEAFPFATADNVIEHLKLMGVE